MLFVHERVIPVPVLAHPVSTGVFFLWWLKETKREKIRSYHMIS
jgi:hypothetical protein